MEQPPEIVLGDVDERVEAAEASMISSCVGDGRAPSSQVGGVSPPRERRIGVAASDETEAAGVGDRSGESPAGGVTHRCQHDRMPDAEQRGERRRDVDRESG